MKTAFLQKANLLFLLLMAAIFAQAQPAIKVKLQLLPNGEWGVFAKPIDSVFPSANTITGTAQVTVVMPKNYAYTLTSVKGTWNSNAVVNGPVENPTRKYASIALNNDSPHITYVNGQETLLFKIKKVNYTPCPDSLYLINNATDPFNKLPNSVVTNPGNEFSVYDVSVSQLYEYHSNYAPAAWSCHDNDNDGILNAIEDTNGNGIFDAGDASNLNAHNGGMSLKLKLLEPNKWGAYVKPDSTINPGPLTITGTAQVTVVMPKNYSYTYTSVMGNWNDNAVYIGPQENPTRRYVSFGLNNDFPHIDYMTGQETLLFTIKSNLSCPDSMYIINNATDPLNQLPNSFNSNPGNEFSVFDPDNGVQLYTYHQNYAPSAWSCHDNDGDGILNAFEDTNGNGVYDAGDVSDLNSSCNDFSVEQQPVSVKQCTGENAYFSTKISGTLQDMVSKQWQYSTDGVTWVDLADGAGPGGCNYENVNYDSLNLTGIAVAMDGWYFRMKASMNGCVVFTEAARLDVEGPITITAQPVDMAICAGEYAEFVVGFNNAGATYPANPTLTLTYLRWQISSDSGTTWSNLTNNNHGNFYTGIAGTNIGFNGSDTLGIHNPNGLNGKMYRMCYTSPSCSIPVYSAAATLTLNGEANFTLDPKDVTVCSGGDTIFVATASVGQDAFTFGWQYSDSNGAIWVDIDFATMAALFEHSITGAVASGTDTLTVKNVAGMYGRRFRAVTYPSGCNAVFSNYAILSVEGPLTVNTNPVPKTVCSGYPTIFQASFNNPGVAGSTIYRWQVSANGGITWVNTTNSYPYNGTATPQLSISNVAGLNGFLYRLSARTSTCNIMYSEPALLTVEGPIIFNDQPDNVTQCSGEAVSFTVGITNSSPQGNPPAYQWQESTNGGTSWHDIINDTLFYGVMTNHLSMSSTTGHNGHMYRCHVSTTYCNDLFSEAATLSIEGPITVTDEPDNVTACSGTSASFQAALVNSGQGVLQYQWEVSSNNGATWSNLSNDGNHSGVTTTTLSVANVANMSGYRFRMRYRTVNCYNHWTNYAILTVQDCPDACILLKLQLLPDSSGWAVMAKPSGGYVPTANAMTTAGRVTVVAPSNFVLDGFSNGLNGNWLPTNVVTNLPGHPGRKYITFELTNAAQGIHLPLVFGEATTLFQFAKTGGCPDSLYLLETTVPNLPTNMLAGQDAFGQASISFEYCGVYARKAWRCKPSGGITPPIIIVASEDSLAAPQTEIVDRDAEFSEGKTSTWFTASPNPADDFVNIVTSENLAEGRTTLALWDLQGRKLQEILLENTTTQLDLSSLPAGVYLVSLAQNGRVVERKKLVRN